MAQKSKFTDRQKKNIVRAYVECQNFSAVARKYGCSETTIRRIVGKNPDVAEMVEVEKDKNAKSVREHMKSQSGQVCSLLDRLIEIMSDQEKLDKATVVQLATTLGIIADKYAALDDGSSKQEGGVIILPEIE